MMHTAREQLDAAHDQPSGRSSTTIVHGEILSEVVMGIVAGEQLAEHANPGEGILHVLVGRVRLESDGQSWLVAEDEWIVIPRALHSVTAITDSAILLTVARR